MSENQKNTRKYLNYVEHLLILASTVTDCTSISCSFNFFFISLCYSRHYIAEGKKMCNHCRN